MTVGKHDSRPTWCLYSNSSWLHGCWGKSRMEQLAFFAMISGKLISPSSTSWYHFLFAVLPMCIYFVVYIMLSPFCNKVSYTLNCFSNASNIYTPTQKEIHIQGLPKMFLFINRPQHSHPSALSLKD